MAPSVSGDPGARDEGEAARERLVGLLADAAGAAVVAGLVGGADGDRPGAHSDDPTAGDHARRGAATGSSPGGPVGFLRRVCALAMSEVGVSGAGVTVMGSVADGIAGHRDQLAAGGALSRRLEDLQLTTGQGPCLDAFAAGAPVLVGDLEADAGRWPGFAPEAVRVGAAAVFSLPLQVGVVRLGTLDLYRNTSGPLAHDQLAAALLLAGLVTEALLEHTDLDQTPGGSDGDGVGDGAAGGDDPGWLSDVHAEVHQASGMVAVSMGIGVGEALVRIRAHAYAHSLPISEVAARIIARTLILTGPDR